MNCSYHDHNAATVSCNGCGRPLCPACDHRIKGFPYCQDCIVLGVEMLQERSQTNYAPYVKKRTSPVIASGCFQADETRGRRKRKRVVGTGVGAALMRRGSSDRSRRRARRPGS